MHILQMLGQQPFGTICDNANANFTLPFETFIVITPPHKKAKKKVMAGVVVVAFFFFATPP
jgi:hypothetical protein